MTGSKRLLGSEALNEAAPLSDATSLEYRFRVVLWVGDERHLEAGVFVIEQGRPTNMFQRKNKNEAAPVGSARRLRLGDASGLTVRAAVAAGATGH